MAEREATDTRMDDGDSPIRLCRWGSSHKVEMVHAVIEDIEDRVGDRIIRRKIIQTDDPQYPSGYRYAFHYGYTDGRGTILRYDNENQTIGRHECHTPDGVTEIDFPGILELRKRFIDEVETQS